MLKSSRCLKFGSTMGGHKAKSALYIRLIRKHEGIKGPVKVVIVWGSERAPYLTGIKGHIANKNGGIIIEDRSDAVWVISTYRLMVGAVWVMNTLPDAWLDLCTQRLLHGPSMGQKG